MTSPKAGEAWLGVELVRPAEIRCVSLWHNNIPDVPVLPHRYMHYIYIYVYTLLCIVICIYIYIYIYTHVIMLCYVFICLLMYLFIDFPADAELRERGLLGRRGAGAGFVANILTGRSERSVRSSRNNYHMQNSEVEHREVHWKHISRSEGASPLAHICRPKVTLQRWDEPKSLWLDVTHWPAASSQTCPRAHSYVLNN